MDNPLHYNHLCYNRSQRTPISEGPNASDGEREFVGAIIHCCSSPIGSHEKRFREKETCFYLGTAVLIRIYDNM